MRLDTLLSLNYQLWLMMRALLVPIISAAIPRIETRGYSWRTASRFKALLTTLQRYSFQRSSRFSSFRPHPSSFALLQRPRSHPELRLSAEFMPQGFAIAFAAKQFLIDTNDVCSICFILLQ